MTIKMDDARLALHYKIEVAKRECKSNEVVELKLIINAYDTNQARIAELEAEVESAQKKAYWQGFETGSTNPCGNILQHYNEWLDVKAENDAR